MVIGVFFSVAGLLVVFGGLLAAADSALSVLSRNDLVELAASSRSRRSARVSGSISSMAMTFSATVSLRKTDGSWVRYPIPIRARRCIGNRVTFCVPNRTTPESG